MSPRRIAGPAPMEAPRAGRDAAAPADARRRFAAETALTEFSVPLPMADNPSHPRDGNRSPEPAERDNVSSEGVTPVALVRSPGHLASLLRANLAPPATPAPVAARASQSPTLDLSEFTAAAVAPASVTAAHSGVTEAVSGAAAPPAVEDVLDELQRRLELEFLRAYGTAGR